MLPADTSTTSAVDKQVSSNVEEKKENTNASKAKEENNQKLLRFLKQKH